MALSSEQINKYIQKLLISRMRILTSHGFYGLLLMHMKFSIDENLPTACTDGNKITFGSDFLLSLSDDELDFVMMHELLHVVLRHCFRGEKYDQYLFNIACDIVVNSNILLENNMDLNSIYLKDYGVSMHLTPTKEEGYKYCAEEVYEMLIKKQKENKNGASNKHQKDKNEANSNQNGNQPSINNKNQKSSSDSLKNENNGDWDNHSRWNEKEENDKDADLWDKRIIDAATSIEIRDAALGRGTLPLLAKRLLKDLKSAQTDWKAILNDFIQEEINDYSFNPPDRRFQDSPFYLPDFNETEDSVSNILFMIDTSGSMSDEMIAQAYSEIKGAIDQFNGRLQGYLGFFDTVVKEPLPFASEDELKIIRPYGGGGTDFTSVFKYVDENMQDNLPTSIIILTDGYAPIPDEKMALGIPVLWIINNETITPSWGKIARIKIQD